MAARDTGEKVLFATSALAAAGAVAVECVAPGSALAGAALAKVFEFGSAMGEGVAADRVTAWFGPARDLADIHRNHHLEAALRRAVADMLEQTAAARGGDEGLAFAAQAGRLRVEDAPALVTGIFAQTAASGPQNPLDLDGWRAVVRAMADNAKRAPGWDRKKYRVGDEAAEAAAQALAAGFPAALRNGVTADGPESPAFAKLVLLMLGETLALVRASAQAPPGLAPEELTAAQEDFQSGLAETVRAKVRPVLEAVERSSEAILREIAELRRIVEKGLAAEASAPDPTAPAPTEFLEGRDDVVTSLAADLDGDVRPNLTGMGGIGKTEVARAVAERVEEKAPAWAAEGVWYVDLSGATSTDGLMQRILSEWPIKADRPSGATIGRALDARRLYVLDDVEQALGPDRARVRAFLRDVCEYAPSARFLVTSRRFIANVGLTKREITHLDEPDARRLFDALADAAGYEGQDGDGDRRDELLGGLDGIPLAITLAAGLLSDYDLDGVLGRWRTRRTAALAVVDGDASRLDSLDVSLGLSVEALPDDGAVRALFALFPLVPAGATTAMLEAVFGDDGEDAAVVLRRRGLVQKADGRFTMRVPVRAYAEDHAEPEAVHVAALDAYLLTLAREANANWVTETGRVFRMVSTELPTFDAALARADTTGVAALTGALLRWFMFARPVGVVDRLEVGRQAAQRVGARLGAANCSKALGYVHQKLGEYDSAREWYEAARLAYEDAGSQLGAANATRALGNVHRMLGEYGPARERYSVALAAYEDAGSLLGAANVTRALGHVHRMLGEYGPARERYTAALAAYEEIGNPLGVANCTKALGDVHRALGEYGLASERYRAALVAHEEIGGGLGAANVIRALGHVHRMLGEYGPARERYTAALAAYEEVGNSLGVANCHRGLGLLAQAEGDTTAARVAWARALKIAEAIGVIGQPSFQKVRRWLAELDG